ncbi:alpha-galactosidase [Histomonas meleagridis]|uniref:alpha-galactosidase n=1 Tax=Histomonas meleagridis TaxID=135588 RepID=UPI003559D2D7|nr:alpha-galactosidase [Histomonas meleagridis]KAH0801192.1 alpha-galactosidase [Histomonas meleagridis]
MKIVFDDKNNVFLIQTKNTTYGIAIVDGKYVGHLYYGKYLDSTDIRYLLREDEPPFVPSSNKREKGGFLDSAPMEYPETGMGDFRETAFCVRNNSGHRCSELNYQGYEIIKGKPKLEGLPCTFGTEDDSLTLKIFCKDSILGLKCTLLYSIFQDSDAIIRSVIITNEGQDPLYLEKVLSSCIDLDDQNFEVIGLFGSWARERYIQRNPLSYGRYVISSTKGKSSHQTNPFIALVTPSTTQTTGEVYSMNFVYSGNFIASVEKNEFNSVRLLMGIHPENFTWKLLPNDTFTSPEVVNVYSSKGLSKMTHIYHDLYRNHLIRSKYLHLRRPILINNWEATYFDFDETKLLNIAKEASELGIEMLVMDDGWFGKRNNDESSLGDWIVNENKIKGGLQPLINNINNVGLKFGIWVEPEMVSPNSDLYAKHPKWAIQIPQREITEIRSQYVLDMSNDDVINYLYEILSNLLRNYNISYMKWDMNRQLTTLGSYNLSSEQQNELSHRYVLGVYKLQEKIVTEFPNVLLENCSGGGGRFDPGMLYYSPQIWCSDNMDPIDRLCIQEGTALVYPVFTIGNHLSVCPNHCNGRITPFETRGDIALFGTFGYELDITKLSNNEKELIKVQINNYNKYNEIIRDGDYYRLESLDLNGFVDCCMFVSKDKRNALLIYVQVRAMANTKSRIVKLRGLKMDKVYVIDDKEFNGRTLMAAGLRMPLMSGDFKSKIIEIKVKE